MSIYLTEREMCMSVKCKKVYEDCLRAMKWSLSLNIISKVLFGIISVFMIDILAKGANYILYNEIEKLKNAIGIIVLCLIGTILIIPLIEFFKNLLMLKESLQHDRYLYGHYLDAEYSQMRKIDKGEIQQRLEEDPIDLRFYWIEIIACICSIVVTVIILGYNFGHQNILYGFIVICISLIRIVYPIVAKKYEKRYDLEIRDYDMELRGKESEFFSNAIYIKRFKLSSLYQNMFKKNFLEFWNNTKNKQIKYVVLSELLDNIIYIFSYVMIIILGCFLLSKNVITVGSIITMIGYSGMIEQVYGQISFVIRKIPILQNCSDRVSIFYNNLNSIEGNNYFPKEVISVRGLSFKYDDNDVLNNINCEFYIGKKNVVIGKNGSGKTTLINILSKLEKQYTGNITLDSKIDFFKIDERNWRKNIGVAFQNPIVFKGTVKENILLSNDGFKANIEGIIKNLELNLIEEKAIENFGENLSGGELQKISIARALVRKPKILILDEPNNNLDIDAKKWLKQFIREYKGTLIYISHDEEMINMADNIIKI